MQTQTKTFRHSQVIDAPPDQVFDFVKRVENLPKYLPPIHQAEAAGGDSIRLHGEVPQQGSFDSEGYYHVHEAERRMEWGARVNRDYAGRLWVEPQGDGRSEVTVELDFGPRSVEPEIEQQAGPGRNPAEDALAATLESIRRQIEGEGGKVMPPSPPA